MRRLANVVWLGLATGWVGLGCADERAAESEPVVRPVRYARAESAQAGTAAWFPARVDAQSAPSLSFRVSGRVAQVRVDVGDTVKAGQLVAVLDDSDYRTRVADARAAQAQARAEAERTRRIAERNARLFAGNAVSEDERDQSRDIAAAAAARLESTQQRLELAERELSYTRLEAPQSGVVVSRRIDEGTNVSAGQPVFELSGERIELRADIPETALTRARVGERVEVRIPAMGADEMKAEILRVATGAVPGQILYPVFLRLIDPEVAPAPGMSAQVRLLDRQGQTELVSVPPTAVVADPDGAFVWVLEAEGEAEEDDSTVYRARRRSVQLHRITGRRALLQSGVEADEKVVTAGVHYLSEGQRVRKARRPPLVDDDAALPMGPVLSRKGR